SEEDKVANDTARPVRDVAIGAFALGRAPVTVAEYRAFRPGHGPSDDPSWPVANVSWDDAADYCAWLSRQTRRTYRLPTEAEWEYACRAGTRTPFSVGAELTTADANFLYRENGERIGLGSRAPVGSYPANAFGFYDLHGNVCEWASDAWRPNHADGPVDPTRRAIRGGGWDYLPRLLRSAWRDGLPVRTRRDNLGFRVAATL
ncbi:MAG: formylglycine-generating enzyme family protein, partial [Chthoniobacteraceae bacterium]